MALADRVEHRLKAPVVLPCTTDGNPGLFKKDENWRFISIITHPIKRESEFKLVLLEQARHPFSKKRILLVPFETAAASFADLAKHLTGPSLEAHPPLIAKVPTPEEIQHLIEAYHHARWEDGYSFRIEAEKLGLDVGHDDAYTEGSWKNRNSSHDRALNAALVELQVIMKPDFERLNREVYRYKSRHYLAVEGSDGLAIYQSILRAAGAKDPAAEELVTSVEEARSLRRVEILMNQTPDHYSPIDYGDLTEIFKNAPLPNGPGVTIP